MGSKILWAFLLVLGCNSAFGDDIPKINQGGINYTPGTTVSPSAQKAAAGPTNIGQIPTPDTLPVSGATGIPAPSTVTPPPKGEPGQYRNKDTGSVNITKMFLDRYKQSMVRVISRDLAGNELSRAMGVGVGKNSQYIATALSIVLGNSQQWADKIEITHITGNRYYAKVAYIDEEKNLVLLAPEANPPPIPHVREVDERPQIDVFTFSFNEGPNGKIDPKIHRGTMAAANQESGLLSISSPELNDKQAGSGIINAQGELVGMLLPEGRGVLTSTLLKLVAKAQKATPFDANLVGAILGRGVLVDPKNKAAFPTITAALEAIKKGEAPKPDTTRYNPAKNRTVAPLESDKVVIKVMPGIYKEEKTITLGSDVSLSGSGPDRTQLLGKDPNKPVLLLQNSSNTIVSGFRIVPAMGQSLKAPTIIGNKTQSVTLLGNVIEANEGIALWAHQSNGVNLVANTFHKGQSRAVSCDQSSVIVKSGVFLGDWSTAISADKGCDLLVQRTLFLENKTSIGISASAKRVRVERSSFIKGENALRALSDVKSLKLIDSLFFECENGLIVAGALDSRGIGRNAIWKSKFTSKGRNIPNLDLVKSEQRFEAPNLYDYRLKPGQGQIGNALSEEGADLGAFQRSDYLGEHTQQLIRSLSAAVGDPELPVSWGIL